MGTDTSNKDGMKPIEWINLLISLLNLAAVVFLGVYSFQQQKVLEEFKLQLSSASLVSRYSETSGEIIVQNTGREASNVQITIKTTTKVLTSNLQSDFPTIKPITVVNTSGGGEVYIYEIKEMRSQQEFAIRISHEASTISYPSKSEVDIKATCSNCNTSTYK